MEDSSKNNESEDDNIGRDKYFTDMDSISCSSNDNEEDSKNKDPNMTDYMNLNLTDDTKNVVENHNPNKSIIENNMKNNVINNNGINKVINQINMNKNLINPMIPKMPGNNINFIDVNNNNKKNSQMNEEKIENISLSDSDNSNDDDVQEIAGEQFKKHFQEDRYGPQRKIVIMNNEKNQSSTYNNFKEMMKKNRQKNPKEENNILNAFFDDKDDSDNYKEKQQQKKFNSQINPKNNFINNNNNNKYNNKKSQQKKIYVKTKKFIPMHKEDYRSNTYFEKLLINRVEKQILTDIYNEYENKKKFEQTYYYIDKIKNIINKKGVEEAIKYLDTIEPLELRIRVINESTYFFKEIIKEEVENAKVNNNELILIKLDEFHYEQSMENSGPLSGKINHGNNNFRRKGKSNARFQPNFFMNKFRKNDANYFGGYNNFMPNPYMYKGQNIGKKNFNHNYSNEQ